MEISIEQLLVGLAAVLPGFVVTYAQRAFRPARFRSGLDQTLTSVLYSVILNSLGLFILSLTEDIGDNPIKDFRTWLLDQSLQGTMIYVLCLYSVAAVVGFVTGALPALQLRWVFNRLGLTRFRPQDSVWVSIKDKHRPREHPAAWIFVRKGSGQTYFGRLRTSSALSESDKPIEVYLCPAYKLENGVMRVFEQPGVSHESDGLYVRLTETDVVQFCFHERDWSPPAKGARAPRET